MRQPSAGKTQKRSVESVIEQVVIEASRDELKAIAEFADAPLAN